MVELGRGLVVPRAPALSSIDGDGRALVTAGNHSLRIGGIYPERVVVIASRCALDRLPVFAAVLTAIERDVGQIDRIGIFRIYRDFAEVPQSAANARVGSNPGPGCSAVIGTIESCLLCFLVIDQRIETLSSCAVGDANANASPAAFRQTTAGELRPGIAF